MCIAESICGIQKIPNKYFHQIFKKIIIKKYCYKNYKYLFTNSIRKCTLVYLNGHPGIRNNGLHFIPVKNAEIKCQQK
jgi:hypothetical protein